MKIQNQFLFILISMCLCSTVPAATTSWIYGTTGPSSWTIDPPNPGQTDLISYAGPIGLHGNSCFARAELGGDPMISVDSINRIAVNTAKIPIFIFLIRYHLPLPEIQSLLVFIQPPQLGVTIKSQPKNCQRPS